MIIMNHVNWLDGLFINVYFIPDFINLLLQLLFARLQFPTIFCSWITFNTHSVKQVFLFKEASQITLVQSGGLADATSVGSIETRNQFIQSVQPALLNPRNGWLNYFQEPHVQMLTFLPLC